VVPMPKAPAVSAYSAIGRRDFGRVEFTGGPGGGGKVAAWGFHCLLKTANMANHFQ
jgi:hypothetical protein